MKALNNSVIVFIAKYPTGFLEKDGASIRFLAIDSIFANFKRVYLESFNFPLHNFIYFWFRDIKRGYNKLPLPKNNLIKTYKYVGYKKTKELFENAKYIYIENFSNLAKLDLKLITQYGNKMILDFHGCAVEEMEMMSAPFWKKINMKIYEKYALSNIKFFISVTDNMTNFYKEKYPQCRDAKFLKLPIYNDNKIEYNFDNTNDTINIIYSGRNYIWQNTELMVTTIASILKTNNKINIHFTILSPDIEDFEKLFEKFGIKNKVILKSVAPYQLNEEYKKAHLGFILRDKNIVNKVACPTKLIEYMSAGIVPIVIQPQIGDFANYKYRYILNDDLLKMNLPTKEDLSKMSKENLNIIYQFNSEIDSAKQALKGIMND